MLFKRRKQPDLGERLRLALWPRRSIGRSLRYFGKRVLRLRATPHAIASGFACGVFAAFIPILGVHIAVALAIAWLIGGNIAAAVIGTTIGNPLVLPLIWAATFETGRFVMTGSLEGAQLPHHLGGMLRHLDLAVLWQPLIEPMLIGAVPLGLAAAFIVYFPVRWATARFQHRRGHRFRLHGVSEPT